MKTLKSILVIGIILMASMMAPINAQWQQAYYNLGGFFDIYFVDSLHGWFTHYGVDKIVHTSDGGHTFAVQPVTAGNYDKNSIYMENLSTGWCGGGGDGAPGKIHRTTNGGTTWVLKSHPAPGPSRWNDIAQVGNLIWFVGGYGSQQGIIMKTSNNGTSWQVNLYPEFGTIADVQMLDEQNVLICGKKAIHRTSDGGSTWVEVAQNPNPDYWFTQMAFVNNSLGYALANDGFPGNSYLYRTTDAGFTWHLHYTFADMGQKLALSVIPSTGTIFVAGSYNNFIDKGIYKSTDGGATWDIFPTNYKIICIYTPTPYQGWAGAGAMIYRYDYVVPPTVEPIPSALRQLGELFQHQVQATGLGLKYTMSGNPAGLNIGLYSGLIQGTPTQGGNFAITVAVKDTDANVVNAPFNLRVNRWPTYLPPWPPTHTWVDSLYQFQLRAEDLDDDTLSFAWLSKPSWLTFLTEGITSVVISGVPGINDTGYHQISVSASDAYGGYDTLSWVLHIEQYIAPNNAPTFVPPWPSTLAQVDSLYDIMLYAEDIDGDSLTFNFVQNPAWLNMLESVQTARIQGVPSVADTGYHPVAVVVADNKGGVDTLSWVINVQHIISLPVNLLAGWNLVSVPLWTETNLWQEIYPSYQGNVYLFDGVGYQPTQTFVQGVGYWANFPIDTTHVVVGVSMPSVIISVGNGWNLIGSVDHICSVPVGEIITSQFWGYQGSYMPESTLVPGRGYWVKTNAAGQLTLGTGQFQSPQVLQPAAALYMTDANLLAQSLLLFREAVDLEWYSMPPLPPEGGFDVRFVSQRLAEMLPVSGDSTYQVLVRAQSYPLRFLWEPDSTIANAFLVIDGTSHQLVRGEYLEINTPFLEAQLVVTIVTSVEPIPGNLPTQYALSQNYPNPFNPVTVIRYALPQASEVTLTVYDLLGQEIVILVNEYQPTGTYEASFNASNLPSGTYFFRLTANQFTKTKKMILLK